jgi:hypothetical protein
MHILNESLVSRRRGVTALVLLALLALDGCGPPTEVVDLQYASLDTIDALQRVNIVPLGKRGPVVAGSIGPIFGYGCGPTPAEAKFAADQQIRVKAMTEHATAVVDVLYEPEGLGVCAGGHNMMARGIAVGPRGIPSSY